MPLISLVINVDTRPENSQNKEMFKGVVDRDFLMEGVYNKIKFLDGFDIETIVFVDDHLGLSEKELSSLRNQASTLIIRKHNKEFEEQKDFTAFNDLNYLTALFAARGKYIFHFDGDMGAFSRNKENIQNLIDLLEHNDYVCYPTPWSPNPCHDESFGGKYFASTRFFCCKRSTLNFGELLKCQLDYDYWKTTYPVPRLCHWLEHLLSSISYHTTGKGVFYPQFDSDKLLIFCWGTYEKYILQRLNNQTYDEVRSWVMERGIHYPCDLNV